MAFPLYLNRHAGIRQTDPGLVEAAKVLSYSRFERVVHVVLPSAVPQTIVGLRIAFGTAWLSLIVAALLGLTTDALVRALERRVLRWRAR